jgi:hypothetical protein
MRGEKTAYAIAGLCCVFVLTAGGAVSVSLSPAISPPLVSDSFDTGNTVNATPVGWKASAPKGTSIRVVDATVTAPASPPNCVELSDNSPTARPEMFREFTPTPEGRASAAFKLNSAATAHAALQLRSAQGTHLCSVVFATTGTMRYEGSAGNVASSAAWTPGQWQMLQIEWFSDFTFTASLGDAPIVQRAHFVTDAVPGRIHVIVGYGAATNKIGYVDDIQVTSAESH